MKTTFNSIRLTGILLIIIIVGSNCEKWLEHSYTVDLVNNSGHNIGYYFATGGRYGTCYPDSLPETNEYIMYDISKVISPGMESHLSWEKFFKELPIDTLSVFIFHTDTLNKYSWKEIRDGYMILKRYDLSLEDLKKSHFKVTYP
jgi:hypothetical protein